MRIANPALVAVLLLGVCACVTNTSGIKKEDVSGRPTIFANVVQEPAPILLGGWKCESPQDQDPGKHSAPVQYWLVKYDNRYALYYYQATYSGGRLFGGWRPCTINKTEIAVTSGGATRFFTERGSVYVSWEGRKPEKMIRFGR